MRASSLLSVSILAGLTAASPLAFNLQPRAPTASKHVCKHDRLLRKFTAPTNIVQAVDFCAAFISSTSTTYVEVPTGAATGEKAVTTVYEKRSDGSFAYLDSYQEELRRRDYGACSITYPPWLATTYPKNRISSACSCVSMPHYSKTVVITSYIIEYKTCTLGDGSSAPTQGGDRVQGVEAAPTQAYGGGDSTPPANGDYSSGYGSGSGSGSGNGNDNNYGSGSDNGGGNVYGSGNGNGNGHESDNYGPPNYNGESGPPPSPHDTGYSDSSSSGSSGYSAPNGNGDYSPSYHNDGSGSNIPSYHGGSDSGSGSGQYGAPGGHGYSRPVMSPYGSPYGFRTSKSCTSLGDPGAATSTNGSGGPSSSRTSTSSTLVTTTSTRGSAAGSSGTTTASSSTTTSVSTGGSTTSTGTTSSSIGDPGSSTSTSSTSGQPGTTSGSSTSESTTTINTSSISTDITTSSGSSTSGDTTTTSSSSTSEDPNQTTTSTTESSSTTDTTSSTTSATTTSTSTVDTTSSTTSSATTTSTSVASTTSTETTSTTSTGTTSSSTDTTTSSTTESTSSTPTTSSTTESTSTESTTTTSETTTTRTQTFSSAAFAAPTTPTVCNDVDSPLPPGFDTSYNYAFEDNDMLARWATINFDPSIETWFVDGDINQKALQMKFPGAANVALARVVPTKPGETYTINWNTLNTDSAASIALVVLSDLTYPTVAVPPAADWHSTPITVTPGVDSMTIYFYISTTAATEVYLDAVVISPGWDWYNAPATDGFTRLIDWSPGQEPPPDTDYCSFTSETQDPDGGASLGFSPPDPIIPKDHRVIVLFNVPPTAPFYTYTVEGQTTPNQNWPHGVSALGLQWQYDFFVQSTHSTNCYLGLYFGSTMLARTLLSGCVDVDQRITSLPFLHGQGTPSTFAVRVEIVCQNTGYGAIVYLPHIDAAAVSL
ncbi:hypothetical protein ABW21_db0207249 [Orbilia brochopaga]|nr:hypothetical protein ABW21_db0207249 [Drechslerella brochopaga]